MIMINSDIVLSTTKTLQKDLLVKDKKRAQNHDDDFASIFSAANTSAVLVPSLELFSINLKHLFFRENCHGLVDKWGFLVSSKDERDTHDGDGDVGGVLELTIG